jgi:hypothetical protein
MVPVDLNSGAIAKPPRSRRLSLTFLLKAVGGRLMSGWGTLIFFAVATAAFTWPLVTQLSNTLPDWGDPADSAWRIGAIARQLLINPFHLYQTNAFYPLGSNLALDELMTGQGLLAAPVIWLTNNPPLAFNLLLFTSFALSGFAMWLLVRHLTGSSSAGLVAGMIFAFSPWHYGQYAHLGLAAQQWMVFALYFLIRFMEATHTNAKVRLFSPRNGLYLGLFCLFFVLQALVAGYYAFFETILISFYLFYYLIFESGSLFRLWQILRQKERPQPFSWGRLGRQLGLIAVAGVLGLALLLPFVLPFRHAQEQFGFRRDLSEVSYWSAAPNSLLRTTPRSWLYKPVQRGIFNLKTSSERMLYPGVMAVLLAGIGLFALKKRSKSQLTKRALLTQLPGMRLRWLFAALALTGLVLSFGPNLNLEAYGQAPTGITLPYKWFYDFLPGFDALRVPQRFGQLFMLGLAVCAGYGVASLLKPGTSSSEPTGQTKSKLRGFGRPVLVILLLALVTADYIAPDLPAQHTPTGEQAPPVYRWLAGTEATTLIPKNALLLELPLTNEKNPVNTNPIYLMYGLFHERPMLNGSANIIPPGYDRLFYEMQSFPQIHCLDIVQGLGVRYLIVHTGKLNSLTQRAQLEHLAGPDGNLELVKSFEAPDGSKDVIYELKHYKERFQKLSTLIPEGSEVLLADHPNHRRLYTIALPRLIGPQRRYISTYSTIYSKMSSKIRLAQFKRLYEYAIFYKGDNITPSEYGYKSSDLILDDDNYPIQVYHKITS